MDGEIGRCALEGFQMRCGCRRDGMFAVTIGDKDILAVDYKGNCGCGDHLDMSGEGVICFSAGSIMFRFSGGTPSSI